MADAVEDCGTGLVVAVKARRVGGRRAGRYRDSVD
jgi:hypothetical protein